MPDPLPIRFKASTFPGSDSAQLKGCICPEGYQDDQFLAMYVRRGCPLHWPDDEFYARCLRAPLERSQAVK